MSAILALQDGTIFRGNGYGSPKKVVGEVVFSTGMVGYPESLTDPSYKGQILCFTYPLVGNYGVPDQSSQDEYGLPVSLESEGIQVSGMIVGELCEDPNHWSSGMTLNEWLSGEDIPCISGIDTRELTKKLRSSGVMMGILEVGTEIDEALLLRELNASKSYDEIDFVDQVSVSVPKRYGSSENPVVLLDCGVKLSIIRNLLNEGLAVVRLPHDSTLDEVLSYQPRGVVISNGPGDPQICTKTVDTVRELVDGDLPILGICLGLQVLAHALDASTFKLKYGHRGQNKPCVDKLTGRSYVTSQNHGYAVDADSLSKRLQIWFVNADDGTIEGLRDTNGRLLGVQYHPEASPGPYDTGFVFNEFSRKVKAS
ncbi:MAG: glutamine-hydrolyzing carbamoyl-phosphate synthase small subunit [Nitrososphaerales archaeon]